MTIFITMNDEARTLHHHAGRIHGHPNLPTPKIHFLLGFRPLYFEDVGLFKTFTCVKKKVAEI